jgi:hypothetical protein
VVLEDYLMVRQVLLVMVVVLLEIQVQQQILEVAEVVISEV